MTSQAHDRETEILITRVFKAPRELVWRAWTEPAHVAQWFGPKGFTTRVEKMDFRVGGASRYVMTAPDGAEYPGQGVFLEIVPMERIVTTDEFGDDFKSDMDLPRGMVLTCVFEDIGEGTRVTLRLSHPTPEERAKHEAMGVVAGWGSTLDCLDEHLAMLAAQRLRGNSLLITRVVDAPRDLVWRAFAEPDHLAKWFCPTECHIVDFSADIRTGGRYRETMRCGDKDHTMFGTYRELSSPQRLVFTHQWEEPNAPETIIIVTLRDLGQRTEVTLAQIGLKSDESARSHTGGWTSAFEGLARYIPTLASNTTA